VIVAADGVVIVLRRSARRARPAAVRLVA